MTDNKFRLTMGHTMQLVADLASRLSDIPTPGSVTNVYGIPRGGVPVAMALDGYSYLRAVGTTDAAHVLVDDIYDSGATQARWAGTHPGLPMHFLVDKRDPEWAGKWVLFPWEVSETGLDQSGDDIVTRLLQYIGEDPKREGLKDTPKRFLKAWQDWARGYHLSPEKILSTGFAEPAQGYDEMVVVHNIPVISKCEHHLADMVGIAHVGYIPDGKVVGLSKLARVVDAFARRLQVQERMTTQVADAIVEYMKPKGVGVVIRCSHACMSTRGVNIQGSLTTTSAMRGVLLDKPEARHEFMALCHAAEANA